MTIGELDQRLSARLGAGALQRGDRRQRQLRIDQPQAVLDRHPRTPPRPGALKRLGFTVKQRQQDRQRVLETDLRQL